MEAAQRFLDAKERYPAGSELWARSTALAFAMLRSTVQWNKMLKREISKSLCLRFVGLL